MHKSNGGFQYWDEPKDDVITLYETGLSTYEIGNRYDCQGSTVLNHLKRWGVNTSKVSFRIYWFKRSN